MQLIADRVDDVTFFTLAGESLDAESTRDFKREIEDAFAPGRKIVLDLTEVTFIDSAGLGSILSCLRRLNSEGGDLKLCCMSSPVRSMFELVRMHRVVEIHDSREDALRAFQG